MWASISSATSASLDATSSTDPASLAEDRVLGVVLLDHSGNAQGAPRRLGAQDRHQQGLLVTVVQGERAAQPLDRLMELGRVGTRRGIQRVLDQRSQLVVLAQELGACFTGIHVLGTSNSHSTSATRAR